jgi:5-(carboxyamino)imidazole ribonucleotide synthase
MAQVASTEGLTVHLYEKKISKPGRKMGHMTLLGSDMQHLKEQARELKKSVSVSGSSER